ncbi:MAG: hypothetical protein JOY55_20760, partial [Mycobacterium sp.]|nr:hypothetical protein [Mycobacterium sp.]
MRILKTLSKTALVALLAAVGSAQAQIQLNLTASRTTTTMPDGNIIPMWGWSCATGTAANSAFNGNATAIATISPKGAITAVTVPSGSGGTGYTTATIGISDTTGTGAVAQAVIVSGVITAVNIMSAGAGYTAPTFTVSGTSTTAATPASWSSTLSAGVVTGFAITNFGAGYSATTPPSFTLTGGGFTTAAAPGAVTVSSAGAVTSLALATTAGSGGAGYTTAPTVTIGTGTSPTPLAASEAGATCTQTNGQPQTLAAASTTGLATSWQPPLITVPTGDTLTITLYNQLPVATSLTIVGQMANATADTMGPGFPTRESGRPQHQTQTETTWTALTTAGAPFIPPMQGARARSFVQEAAAATCTVSATTGVACTQASTGGSITYTFTNLRPGTYLVETGSYPS